ncbi:Transposase for transposon Tn5 [Novipirellula galeiformis]|uniref:Transposase for transposon Tn5 n=1 Tax=Novipirellula galeiformis TaxID=2528004 RepID=A0A5C6CCP2_9BACT|nr:IS4 family transposase [Novipirellula galeiformis]TWU21537.1 Transposase for transposon Tn5 [Novipirellula galeiformis]
MKVVDNETWVMNQFSSCDLKHKTRTKRLQSVASNMLACPEKSLPGQNTQWKDLKAAYRLFDRPDVTHAAICRPHWEKTRATRPGRYLMISDTTDIDHYSHQATTGLGMLGDGKGRGMQLHNCLAYDCHNQKIVGQAGAMLFYRSRAPKKESRTQRLKRTREGCYWGEVVDQVGPPPEGSQWIHVFDRGGDNFESFCHLAQSGCDWVVRAAQLHRNVLDHEGDTKKLSEVVDNAQLLGSYEINVRSRPGVAARTAKINVSVATVSFVPPAHKSSYVKQCGVNEIPMRVVVVQEVDAPKGVTPIRWVLLTSLPVETFEDAWQVIEDYEHRWLIEEYHKVIKSGCSIEQHALRTADRLEPLIALISVIGIRLFELKLLGRNERETKASGRVPSSWMKCLTILRPNLKAHELTVYEFFREIGKLGGFLGRKSDGEPGWQTIWSGYQKMQSLLVAMKLLGQIETKIRG